MRRGWTWAAVAVVAGCAHYSPRPLDHAPEVLAPPTASILSTDARDIHRPWLHPVDLDLSAPLTPDAIATLAVIRNPDLSAARARAGVADAQAFAAGLLPDPVLGVGANEVLHGPDPFLDIASSLRVDLDALRTRDATRAQANAQARQVRLDLAWSEWQTAGQARIQAVRVAALKRMVALQDASAHAMRALYAHTETAAARGDVGGDRLQAARVAALDASEKLRASERDLATAESDLRTLLGLPPDIDLRLADVPLPSPPPPAATLFALAERNRTDIKALEAGYDAEEATVRKAVLDQFPSLALTVNANRDSAGNTLVGPAVELTLPLWNRNRGGIAVERATRDALRHEYEARLFRTRAEIAAAEQGLALAFRRHDDAERGLDPMQAYARKARRAADRGDLSAEAAVVAEQARRDRDATIAQSEEDIREQMIALELLTGTPRDAWKP